jgi:hypothetical protein
MSRRLLAGLLALGLFAALGVGIVVGRSENLPWLENIKSSLSPWIGIIIVALAAGATAFTTRSRALRWLGVLVFLLAAGGGAYLWWLQHRAGQAQDHLALLKDFKAKNDDWKERWHTKYGAYRKLKEAGDKPPAALLTELTCLRLEWIGLRYRKVALTEGPPREAGDLSKVVPDWKELGQDKPVVIVWGVDRARLTEGGSRALLGWEAKADETGHRCVLMADGTTKRVDDETFCAMPKVTDQ